MLVLNLTLFVSDGELQLSKLALNFFKVWALLLNFLPLLLYLKIELVGLFFFSLQSLDFLEVLLLFQFEFCHQLVIFFCCGLVLGPSTFVILLPIDVWLRLWLFWRLTLRISWLAFDLYLNVNIVYPLDIKLFGCEVVFNELCQIQRSLAYFYFIARELNFALLARRLPRRIPRSRHRVSFNFLFQLHYLQDWLKKKIKSRWK